jgi:hypothetical protein
MPLVRYALAAAAACLIGGGVAVAQTDATQPSAQPPAVSDQSAPPMSNMSTMPSSQSTTPSDQSAMPMPSDQAQTGQPANTSATVTDDGNTQVIASQPVPDTPANRAKYGQPMSHAGKDTTPTGD